MKRIVIFLLVFLLLLCGCSQNKQVTPTYEGSFSYESDCADYKGEPGAQESGFVNTEQSDIRNIEDAVNLAKRECKVEYNAISVSFDSKHTIYKVLFYTENMLGGGQTVYTDQNGITQLIVYGE